MKKIGSWLYSLFGFKAICEKIYPPSDSTTGYRRGATIIFFLGAIYLGLLGLAHSYYLEESARINALSNGLVVDLYRANRDDSKEILHRVGAIQREKRPSKPVWYQYRTVFSSAFGEHVYHDPGVTRLKEAIVSQKMKLGSGSYINGFRAPLDALNLTEIDHRPEYLHLLKGVDNQVTIAFKSDRLSPVDVIVDFSKIEVLDVQYSPTKAILKDAILDNISLSHGDLRGADFSFSVMCYTKLQHANMDSAVLVGSHLKHSSLYKSSLRNADFSFSDMGHAKLNEAKLESTDFSYADLSNAEFVSDGRDYSAVKGLKAAKFANAYVNKDVSKAILRLLKEQGALDSDDVSYDEWLARRDRAFKAKFPEPPLNGIKDYPCACKQPGLEN